MTTQLPQRRMVEWLMQQLAVTCVGRPADGEAVVSRAAGTAAEPQLDPEIEAAGIGATGRAPTAGRDEILGESELAALRDHLAASPELFETACDHLMESYRCSRSTQAFSLLYQLNRPRFTRRVRSLLGRRASEAVVDDVLSDVFLAIWMYPDRFDVGRENAFRCWSHTIIRHKVYRALRPSRTEAVDSDQLEDLGCVDGTADPSALAAARELLATFNEQLVMLLMMAESAYRTAISERERLAVQLVDLDGRDSAVAARMLGVKIGNLRMILCRGRRKIRAAIIPSREDRSMSAVSDAAASGGRHSRRAA